MHPGEAVVDEFGFEFHRPLDLTRSTGCLDDTKPGPPRPPGVHHLGSGAGMPGAPEMIAVTEDEGGVTRAHELFAGLR